MTDRVGQQFGHYRLTALLGQGSFAEVYLGQHVRLELQAAIKLLHTHLTGKEAQQFYQEAQTTASLVHPAIVRVFDYDVQEGVPFLVMDYAPGGSLRRRYPKGTVVPFPQILVSVQQVAAALQYAHEHKVIHRDVKPENMLVGRHQQVLLSDFGLAALAHSTASEVAQGTVGTLAYMAPEQIEGHPRAASDQYALGVTVYEWLCGQRPFQGSLSQVMVQHLSLPPPALRERVPTISPTVEQLVLRALAKDPKHRFACVADFAQALEQAWREEASGQTLALQSSASPAEAWHRVTSSPHLPAGTLTLLFTDIERSTQVLQQLGERYAKVLSECRHLLRAPFQQWHGHEVDTQGDAFFVVFARATDAVSATVAAQRALASHTWPEGVTVRVRMGLHTGEPQLAAEGYVGLDVHRAARIMSAGHGGQVLLSQTTRDLVEQALPEEVSLRDLGEHRLKDLQQPSQLFQLVIAGCQASFPPLKTLDIQLNNLPVQPTPFLGREQEVANISDLLRRPEVRLVTLTGPGGVGKTRLSLQVAAELADQFADGVFFVALASVSDAEQVVPTIMQTLSIKEVGGQPLLGQLKAGLKDKRMLLLLDNFEQVSDTAFQIADLLSVCSRLKVLVTSRAGLHVRAEREYAVPPLSLPNLKRLPDPIALVQYEAVALFIERVQAARPDFQVTKANALAVASICARLDGLPLAIELAAARIKHFSPQTLLSRLEQGLSILSGGARDLPPRQQTLRATIAWSYELLSPEEQQLFRRFGVFVDGCTWEAAEEVCAAADGLKGDILEGLASLVDKSLLRQEERAEGETRFWMLQTLREFGLECLASTGELEATRTAHALYYLTRVEEAEPHLWRAESGRWFARLEQEHANLRAALTFLLERAEMRAGSEGENEWAEQAMRLCGALGGGGWNLRGYCREWRSLLERALAVREGVAASVQIKVLSAASALAITQDDVECAEALGRECLALSRELGDTADKATALCQLGFVAWVRCQYAQARAQLEEAVALFQELGDTWNRARCLAYLARIFTAQGEYGRARALAQESLELSRVLGDKGRIAMTLGELARVRFLAQDDFAPAQALAEQSLALFRELGDTQYIAYLLSLLGEMHLIQSEQTQARELLEESVAILKELGDRWCTAQALLIFARVAASRGELAAAGACYLESLAIAREIDAKNFIASALEGAGAVAAAQGEPRWAARLWGAAQALRVAIGMPLPPVYRAEYDRTVEGIRVQLDEAAFAEAWKEGRTTPLEQVIVEVLKMGDEAGKQ